MKAIGRALQVVVLTVVVVVAGAAPSHATDPVFGSWCWLAHWYDMWQTCNAYGWFYPDGESFKLQDTHSDGHSAVMRIWINGDRKSDLWDQYGNGQYVWRDYSLAEGTPIKFQLCIGEYGTKTVLDCEGQYYYGNA